MLNKEMCKNIYKEMLPAFTGSYNNAAKHHKLVTPPLQPSV